MTIVFQVNDFLTTAKQVKVYTTYIIIYYKTTRDFKNLVKYMISCNVILNRECKRNNRKQWMLYKNQIVSYG